MASTAETSNRTQVALVLARWLGDHGYTVDDIDVLPPYGRHAVAALCRATGYVKADGSKIDANYTPSHDTWAAAVTILRDREVNADPFAGFPA
jgi:hypothetical protein